MENLLKENKMKDKIKEIIKKLHKGEKVEKVKEEFKDVIKRTSAEEIARAEEELIKEGVPTEEIHKMCDLHLEAFKESLEEQKPIAPAGHPIHILMVEHQIMLGYGTGLKKIATNLKNFKNFEEAKEGIKNFEGLVEHLLEAESHYLREENVLFPLLEKKGITQPPRIMWMEHDIIRGQKKQLKNLKENYKNLDFDEFVKNLDKLALDFSEVLAGHFMKENQILFPTSLRVLSDQEFREAKAEFDKIGYPSFTPEIAKGITKKEEKEVVLEEGTITFPTGNLTLKEILSIFNTLPIDIAFVDKDDTVKFYSDPPHRIFVRTPQVIGMKVQGCHPQKSIHLVNKILEDFKNGSNKPADFWIQSKGKFIYISYYPVRDKDGNYLGCLEFVQDITEIKKLEGEKRLL